MRTRPGTGHPVITGLLILVALGMIIQLLPYLLAAAAITGLTWGSESCTNFHNTRPPPAPNATPPSHTDGVTPNCTSSSRHNHFCWPKTRNGCASGLEPPAGS